MALENAPLKLLSEAEREERAQLSVHRLPELTKNREWLPETDMVGLILMSYDQINDRKTAEAQLCVALMNGVIEKDGKKYRIVEPKK